MRNALAHTLYELAKKDECIVVIVADISPAGAMEDFRREFPDRFVNVGVAEQSMIGLAAGLAQRGFKPFCYTIATFALFRAYEFIRCDLAYQNLPVTIVGMGAGLSYSTLGGTHQAIEDVAVAMACPNLTVLAPCDPNETAECVRWCAGRASGGPVYLRIGKAGEPDLTSKAEPWEFGRPRWIRRKPHRNDVLVLSYGPIAAEALKVARKLGADMFVVPTLSGGGGDGPKHDPKHAVLDFINSQGYDPIYVIEEASGAPLGSFLEPYFSPGGDWTMGLKSFALPRDFPHVHGTRQELLTCAGLTAEAILAQL